MEFPQKEYTLEELDLVMDLMVYEDYSDFYNNYYLAKQSFKYEGWKAYDTYEPEKLIDEINCRVDIFDSLIDFINAYERGNLYNVAIELIERCKQLFPEYAK